MNRKEQIKSAYKGLGGEKNFYDGMITCSTLLGRAVCGLVWNMDAEKNANYLAQALSAIPEDFSGKMLEVPVGTGVLTMPIYEALPNADKICLDYSADMMARAQRKAAQRKIKNIQFQQGDVGALPFAEQSFDLVLSLNGFHAFPDKKAAYNEIFRVLKPGGTFCGCFYVQGENRRTDYFVKHFYTPKGWFTPPYETVASLRERLNKMYAAVNLTTVEAMACFSCKKDEA
ncbi:MAG: class I SAM-dependent methyltransferase [Gemmiger sp.]|nr:class I SAM-dependent methyltransferase [Gemmiger sp.]